MPRIAVPLAVRCGGTHGPAPSPSPTRTNPAGVLCTSVNVVAYIQSSRFVYGKIQLINNYNSDGVRV